MITNLFLRKIVEESGRREITTSMIVDAEKTERKARSKSAGILELAWVQCVAGRAAAPTGHGLGCLGAGPGDQLGTTPIGIFYRDGRCPYCGK